MESKLQFYAYGRTFPVSLHKAQYADNDRLAVQVVSYEDGYPEPWDILTVNLNEEITNERCAFIKKDDFNDYEGFLKNNNIAFPTGRIAHSGFCTYPEYEFKQEALDAMDDNII